MFSLLTAAFVVFSICPSTRSHQLMDYKFMSTKKFSQMNTAEIINYYGYPGERHNVTTEDGYILTDFRMANPGGYPVLLMHGFTATSDCWIVKGPPYDISFRLWRRGYDVWFLNSRGNLYSQGHVNATFKAKKFYKFSIEEYFRYDQAATIDYILEKTGHKSVITIGHSLGTLFSVGLASIRPEYNVKIALSVLYAQAFFMKNMVFTDLIDVSYTFLTRFVPDDVFGQKGGIGGPQLHQLMRGLCGPDAYNILKDLCYFTVGGMSGWQSNQTDPDAVSKMLTKFPTGTSRNCVTQAVQMLRSGEFAPLSYSRKENLRRYGTVKPPPYPIGKVTLPVAIFYCNRDLLSHKKDSYILKSWLQNLALFKKIPDKNFDHGDFLWARDAYELLYKDTLTVIHKYTPDQYKSEIPIYDIAANSSIMNGA